MENLVKVFENKDFGKIRTVVKNNMVWFVGKDVASALGYTKLDAMYRIVDDIDKCKINPQTIDNTSFPQNGATLEPNPNIKILVLINESGLYQTIFNSTLESARRFKHWVTSEVLPSIRKTGSYTLPQQPPSYEDCLIGWGNEIKRRKAAEDKVKELQPKADFADAITSCKTNLPVGTFAKILSKELDIGRNRLFQKLREKGLLMTLPSEFNKPTQKAMELQLFQYDEQHQKNKTIRVNIRVTPKGQLYLYNMLKEIPSDSEIKRLQMVVPAPQLPPTWGRVRVNM